MTDNMANKPLDQMNLKEVEQLLAKVRKARNEEYDALRMAWGENPTPKQAKQLEKLRKRLGEIRDHHQKVKTLISIYYGENK